MKVHKIKSVGEFHARIHSCRKRNTLFRGEQSDKHPLKPKLARYDDLSRATETESETLNHFKKMARPFLRDLGTPSDDWEWLALAQHHGLATRLLDWTENPLVAAFFAVHNKLKGNAVIYALDEKRVRPAPSGSTPFEIHEPYVYRPQHITPRITAQSGVLVAQHDLSEEFRCTGLEQWVVTQNCLIALDEQLHLYGIHAASVFPGLDGAAKHVMKCWMGYD